uniref:Uncharacterized protein n=1 Tax=Meloidogyne floridensis TaxID=298350 RepID=A0A915NJ89_9BILA
MTKFFVFLLFSSQIIILINCQPPLHDKLIIEYGGDKCEFKEIDKKNNEKKLRNIPILFHNKEFIARLVFLLGRNDNLYFTLWESVDNYCKELDIYDIHINYSDFDIVEDIIINERKYCNVAIKEGTENEINYNFHRLYKSNKNIFGGNSDTFIFDQKNKIIKIFTNPENILPKNDFSSKWKECRGLAKNIYAAEFVPKQNNHHPSTSNQKSGLEMFKEMRKKSGKNKFGQD